MKQSRANLGFEIGPWASMAWDALDMKPTPGVPTWLIHVMEIPLLEEIAGAAPGEYERDPQRVYLEFQRKAGTCMIDQFIPTNPLTMSRQGFRSNTQRKATTGATEIVVDGVAINSPEAVVEHLERFAIPRLEQAIASTDPEAPGATARLIEGERQVQQVLAPDILKAPYAGGFQNFPRFLYTTYGYENYFLAYIIYPELMERVFSLQADLAVKTNRIAARAFQEAGLPRHIRLDHDMADGRGTLVDIRSLDRIWFPHFARSIQPLLDAQVRLIWHCDGNLMQMVPRLIECGIGGFQGFQYEFGMDYRRICRMTDRDGGPLLIIGGVSVTTTLPHGTPDDVRREMRFLVENGPQVGLFLGASSSITPGTPRDNILTFIEGRRYYREHGRSGKG